MSHRLSYVPWYRSLFLLRLRRRLLRRGFGRRFLRNRLGGFFHRRGFLVRCRLLGGGLFRRLRLGLGVSLLGFDLLRLRPRHLGLRRLLAVGENLGGAGQRQILAMPLLAAVVLAPLFLEHDDLVAAGLLDHLGSDKGASDQRAARLRAVAAKQQHLVKLDDVTGLACNALDLNNGVWRHAILLAARANDREHDSLSSLTLGLESRPCLGRLGRGPEELTGSEAKRPIPPSGALYESKIISQCGRCALWKARRSLYRQCQQLALRKARPPMPTRLDFYSS